MSLRRESPRLVTLGILLGSICFLMPASGAKAHDHRVPNATLRKAGAQQSGNKIETEWVRRTGKKSCVISVRGFPELFPGGLRVRRSQNVFVRIRKRQKPRDVKVTLWKRRTSEGMPKGQGRQIDFDFRQYRVAGTRRAWDIRLEKLAFRRHGYVELSARWVDEEGCLKHDQGSQAGRWWFHLRKSGPSAVSAP